MTGGSRIVAIGAGGQEAAPEAVVEAPAEAVETATVENWEEAWDEAVDAKTGRWRGWFAPLVALSAIAGWTGFLAWVNVAAIRGATPAQWIGWIGQWSGPVLVVCVLYFVGMKLTAGKEDAR